MKISKQIIAVRLSSFVTYSNADASLFCCAKIARSRFGRAIFQNRRKILLFKLFRSDFISFNFKTIVDDSR